MSIFIALEIICICNKWNLMRKYALAISYCSNWQVAQKNASFLPKLPKDKNNFKFILKILNFYHASLSCDGQPFSSLSENLSQFFPLIKPSIRSQTQINNYHYFEIPYNITCDLIYFQMYKIFIHLKYWIAEITEILNLMQ